MKNTAYILLFLILSSCFSSIEPETQAEYIEYKSSFDSVLTAHMPRILPNSFYGYSHSGGRFSDLTPTKSFHVKTQYSFKTGYKMQKDKLLTKTIFQTNSNDTCAIKVFTGYVTKNKKYADSLRALNSICAKGYPIPEFCFPDKQQLIDNPSIIYVINSDTTISNNNPDTKYIDYLPDEWNKGYSIGFSTNDKYLLIDYWLVIW
ncbi:hypothetical protein [Carboxylicivirga linearis]|uniref:Lipoprotein n=1 Tax=Carboxylicivirga linearis TaxID=1628157 RepID=A0ABS5K2E3_9BACT|nr:hypothetical protein [Carboxylicivirga linearis]MBS2101225.1 hypothetical protein [Carboxylicivirga linearis]